MKQTEQPPGSPPAHRVVQAQATGAAQSRRSSTSRRERPPNERPRDQRDDEICDAGGTANVKDHQRD